MARKTVSIILVLFLMGCYADGNSPQDLPDARSDTTGGEAPLDRIGHEPEEDADGGMIPDRAGPDASGEASEDAPEAGEDAPEDAPSDADELACELMDDGVTSICARLFRRVEGVLQPVEIAESDPPIEYAYHLESNTYFGRIQTEDGIGWGYVPWEGPGVYRMDMTLEEIPEAMLQLIVQAACEEVTFAQARDTAYFTGGALFVLGLGCKAFVVSAPICVGIDAAGVAVTATGYVLDGMLVFLEPESTIQVCNFLTYAFIVPDELYLKNAGPEADGLSCDHTSAAVGEQVCCELANLRDDYSAPADMTANLAVTRIGGGPGGISFNPPALGEACFSILNTGSYNVVMRVQDKDSPVVDYVQMEPPFLFPEIFRSDAFQRESRFDWGPLEVFCAPEWSCTAWSACSCASTQARVCTDLNACGEDSSRPAQTQACSHCGDGYCDASCESYSSCAADCICAPEWSCTAWSACSCANTQARTCTDLNACGEDSSRPSQTQACSHCGDGILNCGETCTSCPADCDCTPNWSCAAWSSCSCANTQARVCTDLNACGEDSSRPAQTQACSHCGDGYCDIACESDTFCPTDCECVAGEGECVSATSYRTCDISGHWDAPVVCGSGEECVDDGIGCELIEICSPDSWECSGTATRRQCNILGTSWLPDETCSEYEHCESGLCVPDPLFCTPFQEVCDGSRDWHRCAGTGMEWEDSQRCPDGTFCVQDTVDTIDCLCPSEAYLASESPFVYNWATEFVDKEISVSVTLHEADSVKCVSFEEFNNSGVAEDRYAYSAIGNGTHSRSFSGWCGGSYRIEFYYACECNGTNYVFSHASDIARGVYDARKLIYLGKWTFDCPP